MRYFAILFFICCAIFLLACNPAKPKKIDDRPASINDVRQKLPPSKPIEEMYWTKFDGKTNADSTEGKLKDLQGKVVILDFWATYCPPCLEEIPHLKSLQAKYGKENLEIVGLHVGGDEDRPLVPQFAEKLAIDYTLATPENELTTFIFSDESAIPQTAIFDRNGRMLRKFVGFSDAIKKDLDATIEKAINQK